ncbi:cytochrome P450 [Lentzea californiensis]|uniref:cytochrome P450 n=1 Tax=Lentzea californiensis TaxID=438851 RepID=UPI0021657AF1|nr:cytochrome P450 [Lentzea californiensis]MCR3752147.1 Cytochrome P450 [Lentzea californiensis]
MKPFSLKNWTDEDLHNPFPVFARYLANGPLHRADGTWYVFGHDAAVEVLTGSAFGRRSPAGGGSPVSVPSALRTLVENWLVFLDPPRHTELRSVLNKEFSPAVVTNLRPRIAEIARTLLTDLPVTFDLVERFSAPLPILVISELLGVPREDAGWLRDRAVDLQEASSVRAAANPDAHAVADRAAQELRDYFLALMRTLRSEPGDDLVSLMVSAQTRGEPVSPDEIVGTCVHLMTAGHETTTNVLSKSVLALASRPEARAELRRGVTAAAVEELVRFDPPVQAVGRWAHRDADVAGVTIPAGSKVMVMLGAANRDPARFAAPDSLDLRRAGGRNTGFGLGIHYCLGAALARAELEIGLGALLPVLGDYVVDSVKFPHDIVFHGPHSVVVTRSG